MQKNGIINPALAAMLCRFRHTNWLVIADRAFPFWQDVETVDLSLADNIPTVRQVLATINGGYGIGAAYMAEEFSQHNDPKVVAEYRSLLGGIDIHFEPHIEFKRRVPRAIGVIRTGDTVPYGNILLESA